MAQSEDIEILEEDGEEELNQSFSINSDATPSEIEETPIHRRRKRKKASGVSTAVLLDTMQQDREMRHNKKMDLLKNVLAEKATIVPPSPPPLDGIGHFLESMGATMRMLPPKKLAEVKLDMQKLICEAELSTLEEQYSEEAEQYREETELSAMEQLYSEEYLEEQ